MIKFEVLPHKDAPLFPDSESGQAVFKKLLEDIQSGKAGSSEVLDVLRQAMLTNLWFFLKFGAGANGPFHFLNTGVHLDMTNFRQSEVCMREGAKVAIFLPRGFAKTTIFTQGATGWELLRNPNLLFRIVNATISRAEQFKGVVQRIFDANPFITQLFPETKPASGAKRWNTVEMVMPNATRLHKEPSLSAGGVEGASEGDHFDVLQMDDLVGMDDVDANFNAGMSMEKAITWFSMHETLLKSRIKSRSFVVATRYGPGDVYAIICNNVRAVHGFNNNSFKIKSDGEWDVYYRHAIENDVATNPYVITKEAYARLLVERPLVAAYQYANDVTISIMNELAQLNPKRCEVVWGEQSNQFWIVRPDEKDSEGEKEKIPLSECTVCISCDWAGSDRKRSIRTSRSSIGVWAKDPYNRCYRIDQMVGFFSMPDVYDHIFRLWKRWEGYVTTTLLEANAMQKGIFDLIDDEQKRRGIWINKLKCNAVGDKVVRIRSTLGLHLHKGLVYLTDQASTEFNEERLAFPSPRLDVLDESEKALSYLVAPENEEQRTEERSLREMREVEAMGTDEENECDNLFGY